MDNNQVSFIATIIILFTIFASIASSSNTLKHGEILNSSSYLTSTNNLFTLGFFSHDESSDKSYLGLWYTNYSDLPAWIANRNSPIHNNSGVLTITDTGNLVITHDGGDPIKLYAGQSGTGATASLSETGNFVLKSGGITNTVLWQSFDHPTDTLLPGMKLGVNHKTGKNMSLTSWLCYSLPKDGAFTLEWDPSGARLVIRQRGVVHWTTGALKDGVFEYLTDIPDFNYVFVNDSNEDENYFRYSLTSDPVISEERRILSQWKLNYKGWISDISGRPIMVQSDLCNGFDTTGPIKGCQLWEQPKCRNRYDKFDPRLGYFGSNFLDGSTYYNNLSFSDCRNNCWNDCDCVGFLNNDGESRCRIFKGKDLKFNQDNSGATVARYVLISEHAKKSNKRKWMIITIPTFLVLLVSGSLIYLGMRKLRQKEDEKQRQGEEYLFELAAPNNFDSGNEIQTNIKKCRHDTNIFSFDDIAAATNNFSNENKLGQGGFGPVYKGRLVDQREIAVKKLSKTSWQGVLEFENELILVAKLQHTNLVRVLGYCIHGDEKMLVYEYMPNKSLDSFLFDLTKRELLDWKKRFSIIEGIAQGLLYLHKYSRMRVIHRDLKASNILLDENMNPKISDFGMARIFKQDETEAMTSRVVGTFGYMPPEYVMGGTFSMKSDVFSFGVLTLEIVSGRRNANLYNLDELFNLIGYAWVLWKEGEPLQLKDPTLVLDDFPNRVNQLSRTIGVGLLCVQENATDRPTMADVVVMLSNGDIPLPIPKRPAFFTERSVQELTLSNEGELKACSLNYMSISTMEARS